MVGYIVQYMVQYMVHQVVMQLTLQLMFDVVWFVQHVFQVLQVVQYCYCLVVQLHHILMELMLLLMLLDMHHVVH